jgi:hypothetical protein
VRPDLVLREVPLQTPLPQAQAVMERHGFSCWAGVQKNYRTCLYCTAYRPRTALAADKVVVKLYYEQKRVTGVEVIVENNVPRSSWPRF